MPLAKMIALTCALSLSACAQPPSQPPAQTQETAESAPPRRSLAERLERDLHQRLARPLPVLDLDLVMLGEDFYGAQPRRVRWDGASGRVYFDWKRWDEPERGTWSYDLATLKLERMPEGFRPPVDGVFSHDHALRIFVRGEALLVEKIGAGQPRELLRLDGGMRDLRLAADEQAVLFRNGQGIFRVDLQGRLQQLLVINKQARDESAEARDKGEGAKEKGEEKDQKKKPTLAGWHAKQELDLFRVLAQRKERREKREKLSRERKQAAPKVAEWHLPKGFSLDGVSISPSGRHAVLRLSSGKGGQATLIPRYVNEKGYTRADPGRQKVGDAQRKRRMVVVDLESGQGVRVAEPVAKARATPTSPVWSPAGDILLATAHTDDDQHAFLLAVNLQDGQVSVLHEVKDPAWVRSFLRPTFLGRSNQAFFTSEKTGWSQLYVLDADSGDVRQLTQGSFEVSSAQADEQGHYLYAVATPTSPHVRDLVRVDTSSGEMTVLTADGGGRSITLSPNGHWVAEVNSQGNRPWELVLRSLDGQAAPLPVTDSPSPAFKSYGRWSNPEVLWFTANDGVKIPARIYRPKVAARGHPAVLFVHGAGYLQNVHHWWSSYAHEYCFHHILRDQGYTVLDVDYRGSAGYGRDWRCAIYGHMGGRDLDDFVDAARWLVQHEGISKDRIGIYGGSYGGFLTLMALFTKPGVFAAGAALRPVTDWASYNDGYTSNILDDPLESPEHYSLSSPINFAQGLQDHLLICHGLLDFNVHVQGVVRLQQRLIELHRKNWEVAYFPLEGHGFRDAASWSDEYGRIKSLFDRVLKR